MSETTWGASVKQRLVRSVWANNSRSRAETLPSLHHTARNMVLAVLAGLSLAGKLFRLLQYLHAPANRLQLAQKIVPLHASSCSESTGVPATLGILNIVMAKTDPDAPRLSQALWKPTFGTFVSSAPGDFSQLCYFCHHFLWQQSVPIRKSLCHFASASCDSPLAACQPGKALFRAKSGRLQCNCEARRRTPRRLHCWGQHEAEDVARL
jgi:hypothetical protein